MNDTTTHQDSIARDQAYPGANTTSCLAARVAVLAPVNDRVLIQDFFSPFRPDVMRSVSRGERKLLAFFAGRRASLKE